MGRQASCLVIEEVYLLCKFQPPAPPPKLSKVFERVREERGAAGPVMFKPPASQGCSYLLLKTRS